MTGKTATKPRFQHSYSKLSLAGDCLGAFKLKYMDKEPELPSILRDRGRLVHEIMAAYVNALKSSMTDQDIPLMEKIARETFKTQHYLPADYFTEVLEIVREAAVSFPLDWMHVVGAEKFFTIKFGPYVYRGLIDVLIKDGSFARIIDWKTPHRITPQSEVDASLQLRSYGLAMVRKNPEIQKVRCELAHCRQGVSVYTDYDRAELEAAEPEIVMLIEKLEATEEWTFTPGSFCGLCDYPAICPAMKAAVEAGEVVIVTEDDAVQMANRLTLLERQIKDSRDLLKEWGVEHGAVVAGDLVYGYNDTIYRTREPKQTARLLTDAGIDPFDAGLKFENKALDQAVLKRGTPALVQAIEKATRERASSKFGHRKVKKEDA